ncbi:hypothetical protein A3L04_08560 [Thermococcus chitonophagus]|uniref:RecF/RecN/SMC N-terminal domain-containing protein n=1 Tax=Thermococcus chitonophagus TaxID=54262 RepID=A0A2Z2N7S2_9EURY|nr:hypothetical protein A3L04_08560 [Thermococcus chitonophagus]
MPENIEGEIKRLKQVKEAYIRATEKSKDIDSIKEELKKEELELESLMKELDSKNKELKDLAYSQEEFEKIQKEVQNLSAEVSRLKGTLSEKIQQKEKLETEIKELLHDITELEKQLQKIEKIRKFIADLERIRGAYHKDGVQKLLRKKIAPVISELATNYIESFNMDITDIYLSEDFDISVTKNSVDVPISLLSGGEKVAVALSLRLAIARVLARRLSVVIMDEPTTHLDEERRRDLVEILGKFFKAENTVPQIIIVTHHRELEDVADTVYLVQKVDGISKVIESSSL